MPFSEFPQVPDFNYQDPISRNPPIPEIFKPSTPGAIVKYEPPSTVIYPQPIYPPSQPPVSPPIASPRARSPLGGKVAGGFKMPPGSGRALGRGLGRGLSRAVPILGNALLLYDGYQLGCYLGLLPGSICPRPDNPNPGGSDPGFTGGQCCDIDYKVVVRSVGNASEQNFVVELPGTYQGTILGILERQVTDDAGGVGLETLLRWRKCDGRILTERLGLDNIPQTFKISIVQVYPAYGVPDICGDPPREPQPQAMPDQITNVVNNNTNININIGIPKPNPPRPNPRRSPRIVSPPSPLPDINISIGEGYTGDNINDFINVELNFNPQPQINSDDQINIEIDFPPTGQPIVIAPNPLPRPTPAPTPAPIPPSQPQLPPPIPDTLPPDATDSDKYNFRLGREILDKLYKANSEILDIQKVLEKQNKVLENLQKLIDFEVEGEQLIKRCDDIEIFYSYKDKILRAINKQLDHVKRIEQTIITEVCNVESSNVVAAPDWWQVRLNGNTPQLALVFRASGTRTYHKLTIPHPLNTNKLTSPPIESYTKGNWQGEIVCIDNSKFLVNAVSKVEAERIVDLALTLIDPIFSGKTPRLYFAERKGIEVSTGGMRATSAMFFPVGQQQSIPAWRVSFRSS